MISSIQKDFKNGLSISEICDKYSITFKELVTIHLKKQAELNPKNSIRHHSGGFVLEKTINGKTVYYGYYKTLETAEKVKQKLIQCNWNKKYLPLIHKELGVTEYGCSE